MHKFRKSDYYTTQVIAEVKTVVSIIIFLALFFSSFFSFEVFHIFCSLVEEEVTAFENFAIEFISSAVCFVNMTSPFHFTGLSLYSLKIL